MSHSRRELYYHLIWGTKYPAGQLTGEFRDWMIGCLIKIAAELGCFVHAANAAENHVHLLLYVRPDISVASLVQRLKGASSYFAREHLSNWHGWQEGYGVVTLRQDNMTTVADYIKDQEEHHALGNTWREFED